MEMKRRTHKRNLSSCKDIIIINKKKQKMYYRISDLKTTNVSTQCECQEPVIGNQHFVSNTDTLTDISRSPK